MLWLKYRNAENLKIKFEQRQVKSKCSITISPVKPCYYNIFLCICNNFSVQNCLDKPVFNNVSRHNHSPPINNIVTNKIKLFPQLFPFNPQAALKQRWQYVSVLWSIITTALDIYSYKYKDDYICKGLSRALCLVTINIWLNFFFEINSLLASKFDAIY